MARLLPAGPDADHPPGSDGSHRELTPGRALPGSSVAIVRPSLGEAGMKGVLTIVLLTAMSPVGAQNLYRCVDYTGGVSIQDAPCPASSRETRRVAVDPYEETETSRAARSDAVRRARASRQVGSFQPASKAVRTPSRPTPMPWDPDRNNKACEHAKAHREAMLRILGLKRTYEDLQRLDEAVYRACKR